ncbi:MAG: nodulation protein NfeD [Candidatus Saccharibacteria bacterium]|nr:nodulation protein NfeD [Candidatus Saccharibacteria bacterium]
MKWLCYSIILLCLMVTGVLAQVVTAEDQPVYQLELNDDIKAGTVLDVQRAINQASEADASHLIISLETPGGLLQSTRSIVEAITASEVPVVVYVNQPGGWAYSAGTIILLAADEAIVHPNASIGAAQPFSPDGGNEIQDEKVQEATVSWVRGLAEERGRNADIAEQFVSENLTLRGSEALEAGVIDMTATDISEVLTYLDVSGANLVTIEPTLTGQVLNTLSDPFLVSLFLSLGALALVFAVRSGEFEISAAVGLVLLLIGLWGIGIIEFTFLGIGLLVIGAILVAIEVFDQPGFGIFGIGGMVAIFAGVLTLSQEPFYSPNIISLSGIITLLTLLSAVVAFAFISRALVRTIKTTPVSGSEAMIGQEAVVTEKLTPRGRVNINGKSWLAEQKKGVKSRAAKGVKVYIIGIKGNTVIVDNVKPRKRE